MSKNLVETKQKLTRAQDRYKKDFDRRFRTHREDIRSGDYLYIRVERRDASQTRHKLANIAEGPYLVDRVKGHTVVITWLDDTVERVSRDRVTLAPAPASIDEIQERSRPWTYEELIPCPYLVELSVGFADVAIPPQPAEDRTARNLRAVN